MKTLKTLFLATAALTCSTATIADDIAIVGGDVMTMKEGKTIKGATILVNGTTIKAVGKDLEVPDGYTVIDASGKIVTPGLMIARTTLGLNEGPSGAGINDADASKASDPVTLDASWGFNPDTTAIPHNRLEGITRASIRFSAYKGPFSGQGAIIHLGEGMDSVVRAKSHISMSVDGSGASELGGRAALWKTIHDKFEKAANHIAEKNKKDDEEKGDKPDPERDVFVSVLKGETSLIVRANMASDILKAIRFATKYPDIKLAITGAAEGWRVADQLAEAKIPVIVNGSANLPRSFESRGATLANAGRLSASGVLVAFSGPEDFRQHVARQYAGIAVANGMNKMKALAGLTTVPASIYGIADSYGTLEAGKDADIVIWDGDPLEVMTNADAVIIKGKSQPMESRQTRLRDRYLDLPRSPQYK